VCYSWILRRLSFDSLNLGLKTLDLSRLMLGRLLRVRLLILLLSWSSFSLYSFNLSRVNWKRPASPVELSVKVLPSTSNGLGESSRLAYTTRSSCCIKACSSTPVVVCMPEAGDFLRRFRCDSLLLKFNSALKDLFSSTCCLTALALVAKASVDRVSV